MSESALSIRGLNKSFGAIVVAQSIDVDLPQGARVGLIGPNGAGKTTFVNLLTGFLKPDSGTIHLEGTPIETMAPEMRVRRGLARTHQINALLREFNARDNIAIAVAERKGYAWRMMRYTPQWRECLEESQAMLDEMGIGSVADRLVRELPYGQQRFLEIAIALALKPRVLLLDEPAAGVPSTEAHHIHELLGNLPKDIAILIIEHDMDVIFRFAHEIIVLVQGRVLTRGAPAAIAADPEVRAVYLGADGRMSAGLKVQGLVSGYGDTVVLDGISFEMPAGGTLAVLGRNGVGKTTLLTTLMGITTRHAGTIHLGDRSIETTPVYRRARLGLGYVPQEREIFTSLTVEENIAVSLLPGGWSIEKVFELFPRLKERRRNTGNRLSGGEQQMLAVARALASGPKVLLLDEPLEGLAPIVIEALFDALIKIRDETGLTIILIEQKAELALAFANDCIVIDRGKIVHSGPSHALKADTELQGRLLGVGH